MKRFCSIFALFLLGLNFLWAEDRVQAESTVAEQSKEGDGGEDTKEQLLPSHSDYSKILIENLFSSAKADYRAFQNLIEEARKGGVSKEFLLPVDIYYQLQNHYDRDLEARLQELRDNHDFWNYKNSPFFVETKADLLALEYAIIARMAFNVGDMNSFENNVKEAFWLGSSSIGFMLIGWLEAYRRGGLEALMPKDSIEGGGILVPMDIDLEFTSEGKTNLSALIEGKKGIIIDFWATWCGPCLALMPELKRKAEILAPQGIAVVAMNMDSRGKAEKIRRQRGINNIPWILEPEGKPYSHLFKVDFIPRMVLISSKGEILFNGHPQDKNLKTALSLLGITF